MVVGAVGQSIFRHLNFLLPPLIFFMLFFTFCKINPADLRLRKWHGLILVIQLVLGIGLYYALHYGLSAYSSLASNDIAIVSQGLMLCVLMPTASAAAIIAGKLGGSIQNLTSFTMLSNVATAVIVPLFFPVVNPSAGIEFAEAFLMILKRITPLLLCPFFAAWLLRIMCNIYHRKRNPGKTFTLSIRWASMPFYIWIAALIILMADLTNTLINQTYSFWTIAIICVGSLIPCLMQFRLGK